ncbi:transposase [Mesorhizobium sp. M0904]|uniref:transposase n=1 Tax=Mesorhizobium sp. M0904 TaxID=2957022 RepID=UPI00333DCA3B
MTHPDGHYDAGPGAVVALTFKSAVHDPTRFRSLKRVGPWVGLTPSRHQSVSAMSLVVSPRQAT